MRLVDNVLKAVGAADLRNNITSVLPTNQLVSGDNVTLGAAFVRAVADVPLDIRDAASNISTTVCFKSKVPHHHTPPQFMAPLADSLLAAANNLQRVAVQGISSFINDYYPPTNTFEETWRWCACVTCNEQHMPTLNLLPTRPINP